MSTVPLSSIRSHVASQVKSGNEVDAYEDAAAVDVASWPVRAAVADGATESAFARLWARRLVDGVVASGVDTASALVRAVPTWQAAWADAVAERTPALPWYAEAKAAEGAFATLLTLTLAADGTWTAVAVGDCALFHLRGSTLRRAWPVDDPDAFDTRPALLPSRDRHALPTPLATSGDWQPGDAFCLATDAVAAWLLRTDPARALSFDDSLDDDSFASAVEAARREGVLRNDDATLVVLSLPED